MVTLFKDQYLFLIISHSILLRTRNVSDKSCRENRHFTFKFFFGKSWRLWDKVENIVERGRPQTTIWHISISFWIPKALNTHSEYVILISFPTTTKVARTRLNVMLYVHCLSCYVIHLIYSWYRQERIYFPLIAKILVNMYIFASVTCFG